MKVSYEYIKKLLLVLGYKETNFGIYSKKYKNNYTISINFDKEKIFYIDNNFDKNIKLGDETTSNFENSENFVVLECVDRLLEKGYSPDSITLEKKWEMGRKEKGKLDILVSKDNVSYLMIECKTWGTEFNKEYKNMLDKDKKGGQLFSYYNQDRNAEYLCLYTSRLNDNYKIEYKNEIIKIDEELKTLANVEEIYNRWNKQFSFNGIFEKDILPYGIQAKALLKKDLKIITPEDGKNIYNQFLEILRHNVVSDKPNAFNKIFNLFVCKVFDEDNTKENEELGFQWREATDNYEIFIDRLNQLFQSGMRDYLNKIIFYIKLDDIKQKNEKELRESLMQAMIYKNQEFSFVDIFDERDFKRNTNIVKEVVELLQGYQFRYTEKHQFLGDFFENLLNTGFKQEVGQFFTPRILTRFIVQSIPIKKMIKEKILSGNKDFIPKVIDFACGSGHFLTEVMDIIQKSLLEIGKENLDILKTVRTILERYNDDPDQFIWAEKNIYGIENDYRLVKTTKLSCFFNGDGEAQILQTSGIYPFYHDDYRGTLLDTKNKENERFDIVISNPPYSVSGFKAIMDRSSANAFDLYKDITDSSKEIEVIFIERMKQLLKPNGYAAIILPVSILQNDGLYEKARTIILENFYLKGIVKLGSNAFQATGTNTVVLFLQKREKYIPLENKENYINMCKNKKLLIIDTGEKDDEKKFLGYSFSNRRGSEGITEERDKEGTYLGSLLDENDINNNNINKANYYIIQAFYGNYPNVVKELEKNIYVLDLEDCFNFEADNFLNSISLTKKKRIKSKYTFFKLKDKVWKLKITSGQSAPQGNLYFNNGIYPFIRANSLNYINNIYVDILKTDKINDLALKKYKLELFDKGTILFPKSGKSIDTDNIAMLPDKSYVVSHLACLKSDDEIINKYLFYILRHFKISNFQINKSDYPSINIKDIENKSFPFPTIEKQKEIISLMEEHENIILEQEKIIKELNDKIISFDFSKYDNKSIKLNEIISLEYGISLPEKKRILGEYPVYGSNGIVGYHNNFLVEAPNIIVGRKGSAGEVNFANKNFTPIDTTFYVKPLVLLEMKYLFYLLKTLNLPQYRSGLGSGGINRQFILNLDINYIDSIDKQKEIVSKLEKYEQEIEQAQLKINNAKIRQKEIMDDIFQID
ncbi:N-6 DNA methylase [Brachyspira hyodysenteriae]|uniref:N-6 DNA methylase n=1 Tax=Brachyspira hyodysenteriae TaxID=159 RepID=UPI001ADDE19B|nr:N-6 DNA methylase [Brachyspira hyodysenteriae]